MRVLIIDDDEHIVAFLKAHLVTRGFAIDIASSGGQGIQSARVNTYDLILLDLYLPDMGGDEVLAALQSLTDLPPILMLTVVSDAWSKAELLNAGADDYVAKPFLFEELVARMRALLRRTPQIIPDLLTVGSITINVQSRKAWCSERTLKLTPKEFAILEYLIRHEGNTVSKTELIEHVWNSEANPFSAALETHLANLRRKIGDPACIRTVHGYGYCLD